MDAITSQAIQALAARNPGRAISLTHQFLDGTEGKACGFVPHEWGGETVRVVGQWWVEGGGRDEDQIPR